MTADIDVALNQVRKICADIEVFILYAHHDREIIQPLISALMKKDYFVRTPEDNLTAGDARNKQISDAIIRCSYKGFYIVVITQESVESSFVADELAFGCSQSAWIAPVVLVNRSVRTFADDWDEFNEYQKIQQKKTLHGLWMCWTPL